MTNRYDILEFISQREDGAMPEENTDLVSLANVIRRATADGRGNETQPHTGSFNVADLNEAEKRFAEEWAKNNGYWIPISDIFSLGFPGPSGSESDTYLSIDGFVYKSNNLMHCRDSIVMALEKFILYNTIFVDSAYSFIAFTGFDGRSIFPVVKQRFIKDSSPATQNEIDCYMAALGFEKIDTGKFENKNILIWDVLPKNVLKDLTGDIFVIDVEIALK